MTSRGSHEGTKGTKTAIGRFFFVIVVSSWLLTDARAQSAPGSNPTPYTPASIARGKTFFLQNCQSCHDEDGRARSAAVAIAADLTSPDRWKFGAGDAQVFKTIKDGAAEAMPPFGSDLKDDQIWDVVNFIRSIGPESKRPK